MKTVENIAPSENEIFKASSRYILMILALSISIIAIVGYGFFIGNRISQKYTTIIEAVMETKLSLTTAHLWFEEVISGDINENIENVDLYLSKTAFYLETIVEEEESILNDFSPLKDKNLKLLYNESKGYLEEFNNLTKTRKENAKDSQIGTEIDQQYDRVYRALIVNLDQIKVIIKENIVVNLNRFRYIQFLLLLIVISLSIALVVIFKRFDKKKTSDYKYLLTIKKDLELNISQREQIEHELRESELKYRSLFDNMLNGMALHKIIVDDTQTPIDYQYQEMNDSFEKLTGLNKDTTIGKYVTEIIPNIREDKTDWIDIYGEVALEGKTLFMEQFSEQLNRWYNISAYSPKTGYFVTVIDEITDRKLAELEKVELIKDLETKNAELEQFTYTVSHDLKSPLITIKGFLGMMELDLNEGNQDRMKADIVRIANAADKMQALLDELLELSRIGRVINPLTDILFHELAQTSVNTVIGQINQSKVTIEIDPKPVNICCDIQRMQEVMENLVDNAAKFCRNQDQPRIRIGTRQDDVKTVFFVEDNGIGINPKYHEKVFGLFEKLNSSSSGTGIGLAIVKRVIEVHGGQIWVESEGEGRGTAFCFTMGETQKGD